MAARAQAIADAAAVQRAAAGSAAAMLRSCTSVARAREALEGIRDPAVRAEALALVDRLAAEHEVTPG
jgi:hypothetical protein